MILVTGATGNVGAEVVRALLRADEPVRALIRAADRKLPPGVEGVVGDLDEPATLADALTGARGVFLLPGYRDMPGLVAQARRAGVERIVLLSGGAAVAADPANAISTYMIRSEEAVRESRLGWTILRPYEFMSNTLRWVPQLQAGAVVSVPFAGIRCAVVDPYDVAAVAAAALLTEGQDGQAYRLSGPEALLPAERLRILGDALDRELRLEAQSDEEARKDMSAGMPPEYVDAFFGFYVDGGIDESTVLPTVQDVTGVPPRTFAQWVRAHADAFA